MTKPPVADQVQVNFRMPVALRDRIKASAARNGQSMNAEIVDALTMAYPRPREAKDVVSEVAMVLGQVEPELREKAIAALIEDATKGKLARHAQAHAYSDKEHWGRFIWED